MRYIERFIISAYLTGNCGYFGSIGNFFNNFLTHDSRVITCGDLHGYASHYSRVITCGDLHGYASHFMNSWSSSWCSRYIYNVSPAISGQPSYGLKEKRNLSIAWRTRIWTLWKIIPLKPSIYKWQPLVVKLTE